MIHSLLVRLSLSGWFHGKVPARAKRDPPPAMAASAPLELEEAEFYRWMNNSYLDPETQSDIQTQFEESSEISLSGQEYIKCLLLKYFLTPLFPVFCRQSFTPS